MGNITRSGSFSRSGGGGGDGGGGGGGFDYKSAASFYIPSSAPPPAPSPSPNPPPPMRHAASVNEISRPSGRTPQPQINLGNSPQRGYPPQNPGYAPQNSSYASQGNNTFSQGGPPPGIPQGNSSNVPPQGWLLLWLLKKRKKRG